VTELRLFFTAVMFYTRLPVPSWTGYSDDQLNRSTKYFPLVGALVGGVVALVICGAHYLFPIPVAVVLGLAAGVLLTGAFHEDGFADVCDGFGGGHTPEKTLDIMKDSRVGAFAAIGLVLLFALKVTALTGLLDLNLSLGLAVLVFAHVVSRWTATTMIMTHDYARQDLTSKVKPIGRQLSAGGFALATFWVVPAAALLWRTPWAIAALVPAYLAKALLGRWFKRRLGGYTGDCLGATQQVTELTVLLAVLGLWRYLPPA
jgi:adenosylcobinamide-GDP ribazoletransferase